MADLPKSVGPWAVVRELGRGGQGVVYLVRSPERQAEVDRAHDEITRLLSRGGAAHGSQEERTATGSQFARSVLAATRSDSDSELGAAKLYQDESGELSQKALDRLEVEFGVLTSLNSQHLLRVIHSDIASRLFITEYYRRGPLSAYLPHFAGRPARALEAFRGVVDGVAQLHKKRVVHRDIKPDNIFVAADERLVLGDFGIVYVEGDGKEERLTETFERVGSRDWMPPWTHTGVRVEDVRPAFDVFCLAKVLWAMLSGRPMLPLWYWNRDQFNLEKLFPEMRREMRLVNEQILADSIVEEEASALPDGSALLQRVDGVLSIIRRDGELLQISAQRPCRVCGRGSYKPMFEGSNRWIAFVDPKALDMMSGFGRLYDPEFRATAKAFACEACGHIQLFRFADGITPPAWVK
jgi:serine/threonine protein kinase